MIRIQRQWLRRAGALVGLCALIAGTNMGAGRRAIGGDGAVGGSVAKPSTYAVDDLKRMPVRELEDVRQIRVVGAAAGGGEQVRRYRACCCVTCSLPPGRSRTGATICVKASSSSPRLTATRRCFRGRNCFCRRSVMAQW